MKLTGNWMLTWVCLLAYTNIETQIKE